MSARHSDTAHERYELILDTYERLGFPRGVVTNWTLPKADVQALLAQFDPTRPLNILEVGTFVGLSTLLIADHCDRRSRIHTVDPNFPLSVELNAMKIPLDGCDPDMRQQQLAKLAATELGLAERVVFHPGGFATGATFASARVSADDTVPIVGPTVCAAHGPFDVIFLDGLHYESTVYADLSLAAIHLAPGGRIVLHDVIGRWGSNVRRAAWRFVEQNPQYRFMHGRYSSIYDAIGVIQRAEDAAATGISAAGIAAEHPGLDNPEYRRNLATVIVNRFAPRRVRIVGGDPTGMTKALRDVGIEDVEPDDADTPTPLRCDLAVLLDRACDSGITGMTTAMDRAVAMADTVLLVSTPPGEDVATPSARPTAWWADQLMQRGFALHDELRQDFEPMRFAYATNTLYRVDCTRDCGMYVARKLPAVPLAPAVRDLLLEKERRIEDLIVQSVYTDFLLRDTVQKWISAADHYQRALAQVESLQATRPTTGEGLLAKLRRRLRAL